MNFLITFILLCFTSICSAETIHGIVTYVYDGDTFILQSDNQYHRIRLASIDAPELDQPYGLEAKRALSKLVLYQHVIATTKGIDKYQRHIAKVYAPTELSPMWSDALVETEANNYMLAKGLAWHYSAFDLFDNEFEKHMKLENYARDNKLGLWYQEKPTPPWMWRKR